MPTPLWYTLRKTHIWLWWSGFHKHLAIWCSFVLENQNYHWHPDLKSAFCCVFAEALCVPAISGRVCILAAPFSTQSRRVQSLLRHLQLWRATISSICCQLQPSRATPRALHLRSGRRSYTQWTFPAMWSDQVECAGGVWVHSISARSVIYKWMLGDYCGKVIYHCYKVNSSYTLCKFLYIFLYFN